MTELTRPARALVNAAQVARTPSDRDRERVFAAMLATSISSGQPMQPPSRESVVITGMPATPSAPPPPPAPPPMQAAPTTPSAPPPQARPSAAPRAAAALTETLRPPRPRAPRLASVAATGFAMLIGVGAYFAVSGSAENRDVLVGTAAAEDQQTMVAAAEGEPADPSVEQLEATEKAIADAEAEEVKEEDPEKEARVAEAQGAVIKSRILRKRRPRSSPSSSARRRASSDDGARILFAAERALQMGEADKAYQMVRAHEKRYPETELTIERNALRAQALCELGRTRAARRVVLELEADRASDNVLASVDQRCTNSL